MFLQRSFHIDVLCEANNAVEQDNSIIKDARDFDKALKLNRTIKNKIVASKRSVALLNEYVGIELSKFKFVIYIRNK